MNNVNLKLNTKNLHDLEGSIWMDPDDNELQIFAQVASGEFCLIGLNDGNRYSDPCSSYYEVIKDCIFVCPKAKITIEVIK